MSKLSPKHLTILSRLWKSGTQGEQSPTGKPQQIGSLVGRGAPENDPAETQEPAFEWKAETEKLDQRSVRYTLGETTFREVLEGWDSSGECRRFFTELIAGSEFRGLTWETPALSKSRLSSPFEFVLTDSPLLVSAGVDPKPFSGHFRSQSQNESVLIFPNRTNRSVLAADGQGCPATVE